MTKRSGVSYIFIFNLKTFTFHNSHTKSKRKTRWNVPFLNIYICKKMKSRVKGNDVFKCQLLKKRDKFLFWSILLEIITKKYSLILNISRTDWAAIVVKEKGLLRMCEHKLSYKVIQSVMKRSWANLYTLWLSHDVSYSILW